MNLTTTQLLIAFVPALIVGAVAYLLISSFLKNEENRRIYLAGKSLKPKTLPMRMAAYERLTLFLERMKPNSLLVRTQPANLSKNEYENVIVATIEQEFEHNVAQQIYFSENCWNVIRAAKNTTIQKIRQIGMSNKSQTAEELRAQIINEFMEAPAPSETALSFVRKEVRDLF
ncbi:hypothetical protein SAMN05192588_1427 [Nonlabens sp. Hel1_33_55]|uniref:DUF7935 family protein n=1 Tax=Nonlabens sp. Hel1_33_55 TaxID=1336802 RepID=UPI000875AD54|nr:hypothetical protein [Nonlabens sp. Hel1_33_55]SCY15787.1 hypothetical protein SAMN05192588_1427 [Nonlabens sp. Hel1_33_55]